jgi:cytoskeletal protein CcmA (bactofilin family)
MKFFEKNVLTNSFFISNELSIFGTLEGNLSGRIEGFIKGNVKINGKVIVGETGVIEGNIKCYELVVSGVVHGDAVAHKSIVVTPTGIIHGNVSSNSIVVDPKSKVKGSIKKTFEIGPLVDVNLETNTDSNKVPASIEGGRVVVNPKKDTTNNVNGFW